MWTWLAGLLWTAGTAQAMESVFIERDSLVILASAATPHGTALFDAAANPLPVRMAQVKAMEILDSFLVANPATVPVVLQTPDYAAAALAIARTEVISALKDPLNNSPVVVVLVKVRITVPELARRLRDGVARPRMAGHYRMQWRRAQQLTRRSSQMAVNADGEPIDQAMTLINAFSALEFCDKGFAYFLEHESENPKPALISLDKAVELDPGYAYALCVKAAVLRNLGKADSALVSLRNALGRDSTLLPAWHLLYELYESRDSTNAMLQSLSAILRLSPDDTTALRRRSVLYLRSGKIELYRNDLNRRIAAMPQDFAARRERAQMLLNQGRHSEAALDLNEIIRHDKGTAADWFMLGMCNRHIEGRIGDAVTAFSRAIERDSTLTAAREQRALQYLQMKKYAEASSDFSWLVTFRPARAEWYLLRGSAMVASGDLPRALEDFGHATRIEPDNPQAWLEKGSCLAKLNRTAQADSALEKACALDPTVCPLVNYSKGSAALKSGYYQKALDMLSGVIAADSNHVEALVERGATRLILGDPVGALKDFEAAVRKRNGYVPAMAGRAQALFDLRRFDHAQLAINRALALDDSQAVMFMLRGRIFLQIRKLDEALRDLSKALKIDSTLHDAYLHRAEVYRAMGRDVWAVGDLDRAVAAQPRSKQALLQRGVLNATLGQYRQAIEDLDRVLGVDSLNAQAYNHRGLCYARTGRREKAFADYDRAITLNPAYGDAYYNRATEYNAIEQYSKALRDFDNAIEADPDNPRSYYNRGMAYFSLGDYRQAAVDLNSFLGFDNQPDSTEAQARTLIQKMGFLPVR